MKRLAFWAVLTLTLTACAPATPNGAVPEPVVETSPAGTFEIHIDPWQSLHHFAYHYVRATRTDLKLMGRVPLTDADMALITDDFLAGCHSLQAAYAPYVDSSILHTETTRALSEALASGPDSLTDDTLRDALMACMPSYQAAFWPSHRANALAVIDRLEPQLVAYEGGLRDAIAVLSEGRWPDRPIRVDILPYTNWAGAYTADFPPHILISSQDPGIAGDYVLEILFHESTHLASLGTTVDVVTESALARYNVDNMRFWHYVLFYISGEAVRAATGDMDYVAYYQSRGMDRSPAASASYQALGAVWDESESLESRVEMAIALLVQEGED